jgi:hypothetical protein
MGAQDRKVRQGRDGRAGGMTARISGMTGDQISALEMLAGYPNGCSESELKARALRSDCSADWSASG